MKVKAVQSEEKITLPEVREILLRVESERIGHESEMLFELRRSIEHANLLAKTTPDKAVALVEALSGLEKMRPEIAYRIANLMPRSRDELRAIYAKERFSLTGEELDEILEIVLAHF